MGYFIIPFKGTGDSSRHSVNFLWNQDLIFISDNHCTAAWCWVKTIDLSVSHDFIHIDQHLDCSPAIQLDGINFLRDNPCCSIKDYLGHSFRGNKESHPSFGWNNFIPAFMQAYPDVVRNSYFAVFKKFHPLEIYDNPSVDKSTLSFRPKDLQEWEINNTTDQLRMFFEPATKVKCIVDIDLDYFFTNEWDKTFQFLSNEYIRRIFKPLKLGLENGSIAVLTIALSPDCCGEGNVGWKRSYEICQIACETLGVKFGLPGL